MPQDSFIKNKFTMSIREKGIIVPLALIFGFIFLVMLGGLLTVVLLQQKQSLQRSAWNEALHISEAGADYARWRIYHSPNDFNFSGTYDYKNPQGQVLGQYQLAITAPNGCNASVTIKSTGWLLNFPATKRAVQVKYAKPALAKYAFLTNNNVWFGPDEELKGTFHSNGGIRMDGKQNSLATSAQKTYICGAEHGCSPSQEKPGIWGDGLGGGQGLWQFPVSNIDFSAITQNLATIKTDAQNYGIYISQPTDHGFHIRFKSDGTIDVFRVKGVKQKVYGWDGVQWIYDSDDIDTEEFYANYALPSGCGPIFVENKVWVEGVVKGRVTLAVAKFPETPNNMRNIVINGNIDYADSSSVLGLIAQKDILIPLQSPDNLTIKAALLAQNGHVFRYYYPSWDYEPYRTWAIRNYIETYGSIITNTLWTFSWVDAGMNVVSGYKNTSMSYNPDQNYNPPPYFPVYGEYETTDWKEVQP